LDIGQLDSCDENAGARFVNLTPDP
jgi:hypothetical protein